MNIVGQDQLVKELIKVFDIFMASDCEIKPHFILTGPSGSGKSHTIKQLCELKEMAYIEVNAAQLTKEGTSGNSLSKALAPLLEYPNIPIICFVDEFDKLFISGNSNSQLAHETTNGVQNEFLKVLESDTTSVFHDYGKYAEASVKNVLFIFAGAFNGQEDITIDDLRSFGIKTEFLGRVGLVYRTNPLKLEHLFEILDKSPLLESYLKLFKKVTKEEVVTPIQKFLKTNYQLNTLGARTIHTLIHQYFISGGNLGNKEVKEITFQKELTL